MAKWGKSLFLGQKRGISGVEVSKRGKFRRIGDKKASLPHLLSSILFRIIIVVRVKVRGFIG